MHRPGGEPSAFLVGVNPVIRAALFGAGGKSRPGIGVSGRGASHDARFDESGQRRVAGFAKFAGVWPRCYMPGPAGSTKDDPPRRRRRAIKSPKR
jgi:hypothetical protein